MKTIDALKEYRKQTAVHMSGNNPYVQNKDIPGLAAQNEAQLFYTTGGIFADCELQPPIMNVTIQPVNTLANMIPVMFDNSQVMKFGYITEISEGDTDFPETPCDDEPTPGDVAACYATCEHGRYSAGTKTLELDAIIRKAHRGVRDDLYLLGSVRGVSAIASAAQINDQDFVKRAVVRRQISLVGRKLQRSLAKAFWVGDPTDPAQNSGGGGRKAFMGLDLQIANDYGAGHPGVTGTNCVALNSDIKNFPHCVNGADSSGRNIYDYLKALEFTLWNRANGMGLLPVVTAIVMRSEMWYALLQVLPCQIMGTGCGGVNPVTGQGVTVVSNDGSTAIMRDNMAQSMSLSLNGRNYSVVIDDFIPTVAIATPGGFEYTSTIYFVPLTVAGESVLRWVLVDYNEISPALAGLPGDFAQQVGGHSDGGRFHWALTWLKRCFNVSVKIEPCLHLLAPQLAGRIDNVRACLLQDSSVSDPADVSY